MTQPEAKNWGGQMKLGASIIGGIVVILISFLALGFFAFIKLEGNEVGVQQDWGGVRNELMLPGTHIYNNFLLDVHKYNIGTQKITFDDTNSNPEAEYPRIVLDIGENGGQKAWIAMSVNYHLNPEKAITLHKQGIGNTYESVVLKREIVDVVNEIARPRTALAIYSGEGFVTFKNDVETSLKENHILKDRGLEVENTIIYKVYLDPQYEAEIAGKQIAGQQKLRKVEETLAAQEEAKRIFAMSQAEVERARQVAEAAKITEVTAAEAKARKTVLDAEAERDSNLARASGELAVGKARAEVKQLESASLYAGEAGARRAEVEIKTKQAEMMKEMLNHITVLPEKTFAQIGKSGGVLISGSDTSST